MTTSPADPPAADPVRQSEPGDDLSRMAPIYAAVILVEVVTLLALWWFQSAFSS